MPLIYYAGDAAGWVEACTETGADVIGLDWRIDLDAARARVGTEVALQGNLDPTILLGSRSLIRQRTRRRAPRRPRVTGERPRAAPDRPSATSSISGTASCRRRRRDHARLLVDSVREFSEITS